MPGLCPRQPQPAWARFVLAILGGVGGLALAAYFAHQGKTDAALTALATAAAAFGVNRHPREDRPAPAPDPTAPPDPTRGGRGEP